jgi:hypothetical protein
MPLLKVLIFSDWKKALLHELLYWFVFVLRDICHLMNIDFLFLQQLIQMPGVWDE